MNKDNQIMSLLSDIDEELIDDILEEPIFPEKTANPIKADKKSIFAKFALPVAACLVVAAVSVGVLIFGGRNLPTVSQTTETSAVTTPANTSEVTTPANTFTEVSQEQAECETLVADELDVFQRMGCTYSCGYIDLNFDGTKEIVLYPDTGLGSVFFFEKTEQGCKKAGTIDIESLYALNSFENLRLYDKNGEKYYYYYYFGIHDDYCEEKGIAKIQLEENTVTTESLLCYGGYIGEIPDDMLINHTVSYHKKDDISIPTDEFISLWSEYEGVPAYQYEEYWENGEISLDNVPLLSAFAMENAASPSDLTKEMILPDIKGSFTMGRRDSYNFNYEGTIPKVILCQKDCGENKISLLGYKVRTDNAYDENGIAIHRLMLVLSDKNGNLLDVEKVTMPTSSIYEDCVFPINYIDDSLEVANFGENQVILYRCISEDNLFQRSKPFGVKENQILPCLYSGTDYEDPEHYVPSLSALYTVDKDSFSITDEITNESLCFDFSGRYNLVEYVVNSRETDDTFDIGEYLPVSAIDIPIINAEGLNYKEQARYILENAVPKVLFAQKTLTYGGSTYTLSVIADKVWSYPTDFLGNKTSCASKRTAVFKDGEYLGSALNRQVMNRNFYSDYMPEVCYFAENDALVIVSVNPGISGLGISGKYSFAAVKGGVLYPNLIGSNDDTRNKPDWAKELYGYETPGNIDIETNDSTLTCGYFVYRFNFDDENFGKGESDFNVSWREVPPDA